MYWLLAASYYFYMSWNALYALLIGGSTVITYTGALLFSHLQNKDAEKFKKGLSSFFVSVSISVSLLYSNMATL